MQPLRKILLVEDEPATRSVTAMALGKLGGFTLDVCASGEEAIERCAAFAPDLLLLDVIMPELNGVETLERLRSSGLKAPVVFFTRRVAAADIERFNGLGALGVIAKPFDPLKLPAMLEELWKKHHRGGASSTD